MKDYKLTPEEQSELESIEDLVLKAAESGEPLITEDRKQELQKIAENTVKKNERINIRLSTNDLNEIKLEALKMGLPYQTFTASIIHQYLNGSLKPRFNKK